MELYLVFYGTWPSCVKLCTVHSHLFIILTMIGHNKVIKNKKLNNEIKSFTCCAMLLHWYKIYFLYLAVRNSCARWCNSIRATSQLPPSLAWLLTPWGLQGARRADRIPDKWQRCPYGVTGQAVRQELYVGKTRRVDHRRVGLCVMTFRRAFK